MSLNAAGPDPPDAGPARKVFGVSDVKRSLAEIGLNVGAAGEPDAGPAKTVFTA
jgi:hypothetical protein